jgi:hypothetical protein
VVVPVVAVVVPEQTCLTMIKRNKKSALVQPFQRYHCQHQFQLAYLRPLVVHNMPRLHRPLGPQRHHNCNPQTWTTIETPGMAATAATVAGTTSTPAEAITMPNVQISVASRRTR